MGRRRPAVSSDQPRRQDDRAGRNPGTACPPEWRTAGSSLLAAQSRHRRCPGDDRGARQSRAEQAETEAERDEAEAARADTAADEADLAAQLRTLRESQARFELYTDRADEWRWRLRHRNGNIISDSGQGYSDRSGARDGIESVKRNLPNAEITDE